MSSIGATLKRMFSRDDAGIAVPVMDGVFKPNNRLETARRLLTLEDIDNLAGFGGELLASSGTALHRIAVGDGATDRGAETFEAPVTFVATSDTLIAVGLRGAGIRLGTPGAWTAYEVPREMASCLTAATVLADGRLAMCVGSRVHGDADWKRDLMERGSSGCVVLLNPSDGSHRVIAQGLAYPNGVIALGDGRLAVSESWRHRIVALPLDGAGRPEVLLDDLPAYPSRLSRALDGTVWLALFAPRRQLFELVLREHDYRREMIETIDPDEWVGPELSVSNAPDQPLQQGSVRQMGILKPWSPSPSYGLAARCGADMRPLESFHSRADGQMHGITSVCETDAGVFAASRGSGTLLRLTEGAGG